MQINKWKRPCRNCTPSLRGAAKLLPLMSPDKPGGPFLRPAVWKAILILVLAGSRISYGQGQTISLSFDSLPSAQGWTYFQGTELPETNIFSVNNGALLQNTIGIGFGSNRGPNYAQFGVVDVSKSFTLSVRARVLASEGPGTGGFMFDVRTAVPNYEYIMQFTTSNVSDALGNSVALDTTVFHDYLLTATPGSNYSLYIDGQLRLSGPPSNTGAALNAIQLGDGADLFANARAEVTHFVFTQGVDGPGGFCGATDVTSQFRVLPLPFHFVFGATPPPPYQWTQQFRVSNTGPGVPVPIFLVIRVTTPGATIVGQPKTTCEDPAGDYLILVPGPTGPVFPPRTNQTIGLLWTTQSGFTPAFTVRRVISGIPSR